MKKRRRLFGPSQKEIWKQFSDGVQGEYQQNGFGKTDKVYAKYKEWEICLDNFVVSTGSTTLTYTRFRAAYVFRDNFTFRIYRQNLMHSIGKKFGLQDIEVGYEKFDREFIIQGSDERKLKMLFSHERIRDLLKGQKHIELKIKEDEGIFKKQYPDGINELCFNALGVIKDIERLYGIYDLFTYLLDHLYEIGTADTDNPEFSF